jgi:hypothetical protein
MPELTDNCEGLTIYSRAEPDDEYNPHPKPSDPNLIDEDDPYNDIEDEDEEDDEYSS